MFFLFLFHVLDFCSEIIFKFFSSSLSSHCSWPIVIMLLFNSRRMLVDLNFEENFQDRSNNDDVIIFFPINRFMMDELCLFLNFEQTKQTIQICINRVYYHIDRFSIRSFDKLNKNKQISSQSS